MGGTKGLGAFSKGSQEAATLLQMFMTNQLDTSTATPADVHHLFPSLHDKTATQFRSGFHRVKEMARESTLALGSATTSMLKNLFLFNFIFVRKFRLLISLFVFKIAMVSHEKKSRKGIFKSSGEKLTEEQQEMELSVLNPMGRSGNTGAAKFLSTSTKKKPIYMVLVHEIHKWRLRKIVKRRKRSSWYKNVPTVLVHLYHLFGVSSLAICRYANTFVLR
jgi:hypothetical protein